MYEHITHTVLLRGNFIVLFIVVTIGTFARWVLQEERWMINESLDVTGMNEWEKYQKSHDLKKKKTQNTQRVEVCTN